MIPNKAPFYYKCTNCGHFFSSDKNLHAPSYFSLTQLNFNEDIEIDKDGNIITKIELNNINDNKKESIFKKIFKKLSYPKCPKCQEHAVVSMDHIIHK